MSDSVSYVGGVTFGKDIGAEKTPLSTSSRFVSYVYSLLALIMINSYCANLMAFLVEETFGLPINGIGDPKVSVNVNGLSLRKIIKIKSTVHIQILEILLPPT